MNGLRRVPMRTITDADPTARSIGRSGASRTGPVPCATGADCSFRIAYGESLAPSRRRVIRGSLDRLWQSLARLVRVIRCSAS